MDNVMRAKESLRRVLAEIDWAGGEGEPAPSYRVDLGPPHVPVSDVVVGIDEEGRTLMFIANFAPEASAATRDEVARRINRANWELALGNFEMDEESGAVRFRSSLGFGGGELELETIRGAILGAMQTVEAHADAISAAIAGRVTA